MTIHPFFRMRKFLASPLLTIKCCFLFEQANSKKPGAEIQTGNRKTVSRITNHSSAVPPAINHTPALTTEQIEACRLHAAVKGTVARMHGPFVFIIGDMNAGYVNFDTSRRRSCAAGRSRAALQQERETERGSETHLVAFASVALSGL